MNALIMTLFLFMSNSQAYPTYVRLGYTSCTGCHVSSQGGGLLTEYGKGIASTQALLAKEPEEETSSRTYIQAFQARLMRYKTESETRLFPMQADYLAHDQLTETIHVDGILAVAPKPKDEDPKDKKPIHKRLYARTLSLSWILQSGTKGEQRLSFGIGALSLGIGLVDHTAFVRSENRNQVTDNPVALKHYFSNEHFQGHSYLFTANPNEGEGNKEQGAGLQWFWKPIANLAIGTQGLLGKTESIKRKLVGLVAKGGIGKWAFLSEYNLTKRELLASQSTFNQWTGYHQISFYPLDFWHVYISYQNFRRDQSFEVEQSRNGLGTEWRILPNLSASYEYRIKKSGQTEEVSQLAQLYFNWW
ncbi:MAG: hypothetical protein COW00_10600 [Bdellovibrio sp. CG12_big_fil_rev_8_21_14_0_65_39_13]|nr:MAG: hypothetical protein COW78_13775 [Bdellovibrio sp. CG22_combo_CG10-13_8_21_14_all_39_27]PIQ59397.1 MAG: hypothetical protein COW00_10600 [Bdellovibrio sp. CG12_big_fil_rev_8_21_14_0_65_39_13]PJB52735.1 MAG: hypothetical protein CO099_11045 [Bdellovibrio sp. CG_4_9_14_3_um_filter_39_7]